MLRRTFAALVVASAGLAGCTTPTGAPPAGPASAAAPSAGATAAPAATSRRVEAATPRRVEPVAKRSPSSKPAGKKAVALPDSSTLVTISVAGKKVALVASGKERVSASAKGTPLRFHLIAFEDEGNYQISPAGPKQLCLTRTVEPVGSVRLAKCDVAAAEQRFTIAAAASGFYVGGTDGEFLYQGVGDVASFDVTPDFEPDHWTFTAKGIEPID